MNLKAIIVVGPDRIGKTPFIEIAQKLRPNWLFRRPPAADDPLGFSQQAKVEYCLDQIEDWGFQGGLAEDKVIVYDRFPFPDEIVYGPIIGPEAQTSIWEPISAWADIHRYLVESEVLLLLIVPESSKVGDWISRLGTHPDELVNSDQAIEVLNRYNSAYKQYLGKKFRLLRQHEFNDENVEITLKGLTNFTQGVV